MKKSELRQLIREEIQKLNEKSTRFISFNAKTPVDYKKILKIGELLGFTTYKENPRDLWVKWEEKNPDSFEKTFVKYINKLNINGFWESE